jgi:hemoglobin
MSADPSTSLYDRIGGASTVDSLVEAFYVRVLADPVLVGFFHHTPLDRLSAMQKEFFSLALGGPVNYTGCSLAHAHHGRGITHKHFSHFVDHLLETLRDIGIDEHDADLIIEHINTFANDINGVSY